VSSCSLFATASLFPVKHAAVAFNNDSAGAGLAHCSTLILHHTRFAHSIHYQQATIYYYEQQPSSTATTHARIEQYVVATMSTVARGGRGGRGRGASTGPWRGSSVRGGPSGASTDSSDKPAFGAKKRGGGAPNRGGNTRNTAGTHELGEDGKPKK
jgi:hypothetical protein